MRVSLEFRIDFSLNTLARVKATGAKNPNAGGQRQRRKRGGDAQTATTMRRIRKALATGTKDTERARMIWWEDDWIRETKIQIRSKR